MRVKGNMKILKFILIGLAVWIGLGMAWALVKGLVALAFKLLIPLAIVGGVGYLVYRSVRNQSALPGSRRPLN